MSTVVKDLGAATAYGYAVEKGYTGTEAEFAELMASYATVGQTAVTAAQTATTKASEAATSATTATTKASEATTAATTATTKAGEASTSASTATSAKDTAVSASQTATTKASEATTAAATATSAKTDAVAANTAAQSAKTAAQTAQTGAETAAASVQSSAAQIQTNADDISQLKSDLTKVEEGTLNGYECLKFQLPANSGVGQDWSEYYIKDFPTGSKIEVTFLGYSDTNFTRLMITGYKQDDTFENIILFSTNAKSTQTVTTSKDFVKLRFTLRRSGSYNNAESYEIMINANLGYGLGQDMYDVKSQIAALNSAIYTLNGVKWDVMGDSLTNKDSVGQSKKNYVDWIATANNMSANNVAVGGKAWWNGFLDEVANLRYDADIVTIFGSFNNIEYCINNVGTPSDVASASGSFCARVKNILDAIYQVKNDVKIGVILPTPWVNFNPYDTDATTQSGIDSVLNALSAVCKIYNIPVLDLYHESNLRPWDEDFRNDYFRLTLDPDTDTYIGDGVHPNENGHRYYLSPKIETFIKSIVRNY